MIFDFCRIDAIFLFYFILFYFCISESIIMIEVIKIDYDYKIYSLSIYKNTIPITEFYYLFSQLFLVILSKRCLRLN